MCRGTRSWHNWESFLQKNCKTQKSCYTSTWKCSKGGGCHEVAPYQQCYEYNHCDYVYGCPSQKVCYGHGTHQYCYNASSRCHCNYGYCKGQTKLKKSQIDAMMRELGVVKK